MEIIVTGGLLAVLLLALQRQLALRLQLAKSNDKGEDRHAQE